MKQFTQKYISNIKKISKITLETCGTCRLPYACCDPMYGDIVEEDYPEESKYFQKGTNRKCQFLLSNGCSVPPEYRPLCSVHTCERNLYNSEEFTEKYFKLREILSEGPF